MHSVVTSKNESWPRLIWPTLCVKAFTLKLAVVSVQTTELLCTLSELLTLAIAAFGTQTRSKERKKESTGI